MQRISNFTLFLIFFLLLLFVQSQTVQGAKKTLSDEDRERRQKHWENVCAAPGFTAGFAGQDFLAEGERGTNQMLWRGKTPFEKKELADGMAYVSLDDSTLAGESVKLFREKDEAGNPRCRAFSVEVRIRPFGQGEQLGGGGARNGMIFCQGNGYWGGLRLVSNSDSGNVSLNIGKQPACASTSLLSPQFAMADGVWNHLCAVWDGEKMYLYLNGFLVGTGEYSGPFVPDGGEFLLGFGGAGVGSLKMDVCECVVFDRALDADEVFSHALGMDVLKLEQKKLVTQLADSTAERNWSECASLVEELLEICEKADSRNEEAESEIFMSLPVLLRFRQIALYQQMGKFEKAQKLTLEALLDESIPLSRRAGLAKRLLPNEKVRVWEVLPKKVMQILDQMVQTGTLTLSPRQTFAFREAKALNVLVRTKVKREPGGAAGTADSAALLKSASDEFAALSLSAADFWEGQALEVKRWELRYRQGLALFRAGELAEAASIFRKLAGRWTETETSTGPGITDLTALRRGAAREMFNRCAAEMNSAKRLASKRSMRHHEMEGEEWNAYRKSKNSGASLKAGKVPEFILPADHVFGAELEVSSFAELEAARERIRELKKAGNGQLPKGGVKVSILPGTYPVYRTFTLTAEDAGTEESPILYAVKEPKKTLFTGGLDLTRYAVPVKELKNDSGTAERLTPEAAANVWAVRLNEVPGFKEFLRSLEGQKLPSLGKRGGGSGPTAAPWIQLYAVSVKDSENWHMGQTAELLTLARYPNDGYLTIDEVRQGEFKTENSAKPAIFTVKETFEEKRLQSWKNAPDAWLFGSWTHLWTQCGERLRDLNLEEGTFHTDARDVRAGHPFFVLNVLEELDSPGEWFLDRETQTVYFWKGKFDAPNARYCISLFDQPFISMEGADWTIWEGLTLELGSRFAVKTNGKHNQLVDCTLRNFGTWGVVLNGTESGLYACNLAKFAGGAIQMHGGKTTPDGTEPAGLFVENTEIDGFALIDLAYTPGFHIDGTGNRVTNCRIHDTPHHVFRVEGMEHTIEYCEVFDAVYQADDQGAIDMWVNPALRGILFRNNYWHHIGTGCLENSYRREAPSMTEAQRAKQAKKLANCFKNQLCGQGGIRLDDAISSVVITGNVFQECSSKNFGCVQIHGGKDNVLDNNLFIGSVGCVSLSPWGEERWMKTLTEKCPPYMERVTGVRDFDAVGECALTRKYPDLRMLRENPDRNFFSRNLVLDCKAFFLRDNGKNEIFANTMLCSSKNDFLPDPDSEKDGFLRFRLPYDSPLYDAAGMTPIPMEAMGLYPDGRYRKD